MSFPRFLPSRDLLAQVEGVERGLRRGRRVRLLGVVLAAVQVTVLVTNDQWFADFSDGTLATLDRWLLYGSVFVLAFAVLLASWTRFWLRESKQPFRYTYTIARFTPVDGDAEQPLLVPLHADLQERLSMRIRRLSRLGERGDAADQPPVGDAESHLHVTGEYAVRRRPPDPRWFVEISPWVRVGGPERPATLGVPVKYWIVSHKPGVTDGGRYAPALDAQHYEEILERAYFSIATEIYRRIREDVSGKIALLPSRWFRASALFHEAQDYARSNTLDAYEEAADLYAATLDIYDPGSAPPPRSGVRRPFVFLWRLAMRALGGARSVASHVIPRFGRAEVLAARAQVGYANTRLDTAVLAPLSGLQARAVFEAAPIAKRAVRRLRWLSADVDGRDDTCFDANVTLAFARVQLNARSEARAALATAAADQPSRADQDPRYVFVRAELEDRLLARLPLYQRAVELEPRFEAAQFQLASTSEMLWRSRDTLERSVADTVLRQYREVLRLNPGNVAAWANSAYMWWLLGDLSQARRFYESGRRLKEIKPQAFVAELDHGLARIAAEQGRFEAAYDHGVQAVSAMIAQGWSRGSYEEYQFRRFTRAMLDRFAAYRDAATAKRDEADAKDVQNPTRRVRQSVLAFVLYDYSQACRHYYLQTNDYAELQNGLAACQEALECNERFVLATYNLYKLECEQEAFASGEIVAGHRLDDLEKLEPGWPEAALSQLIWNDREAARLRAAAANDRRDAKTCERMADQLEIGLLDKREYTGFGSTQAPPPGSDGEQGGYERVARLRADAAALRTSARKKERDAESREAKARDMPRRLLPHEWLWGRRGLRWRVVRSRGAARQLLWERNLEAFHVRALFAWCKFLSDKPGGQHRLDGLLDLIEERFWPGDLDLLELRVKRADGAGDAWTRWIRPEAATSYRNRINEVITAELIRDGDPFAGLRHLDLERKDSIATLVRVAYDHDVTPYLHHWVGERLLARWRSTKDGDEPDEDARGGAMIALQRAIGIDQPDAVLKLADQLDELGYAQAREPLYAAAVKSSGTPRQLVEMAERYEAIGNFIPVPDLYRQAMRRERSDAARLHDPAFYRARIAAALFALGDHRGALAELRGVPPDGGTLGASWRAGLTGRMLELDAIGDRDAQLRVRDWLGATQRSAIVDGDAQSAGDAAEGAQELARGEHGRALWRRPVDEEDRQLPVLLPVIVEGDQPSFYPHEEKTEAVGDMIDTKIPAIRDAIGRESGIFIPGFRISSSQALGERGYRILIHEIEVERGVVPDVDDPHAYMLERAGQAIRARLSSFVDMQSLEALVEQWVEANGADARRLADEALDGEPRRRAFLTLVKLLVADGVRIDDLRPALDAIAHATIPGADLRKLATDVRARMGAGLRARELESVTITQALEDDLERAIPQNGDSAPFALPAAVIERLRGELRGLSRAQDEVALVVRSPNVRAAISELVAPTMSGILVVSQEEVAPGPSSRGGWIVSRRRGSE